MNELHRLSGIALVVLMAAACADQNMTDQSSPKDQSSGAPSFAIVPSSGDCTFTPSGNPSTNTLVADCSTSTSIVIPNGETLDGNGHTITAEIRRLQATSWEPSSGMAALQPM